ncbi:MAG TPA: hypothetical protein VJR89_11590 [Polyangiales bacterium]|nr:hypothetical protein [Polyangiales bacterium]
MKQLIPFAAFSLLWLACDSSDDPAATSHPSKRRAEAGSSAPDVRMDAQPSAAKSPADAFGPNADVVAWSTESFELDAGQERYLCFAKTLEEDLVVNGYSAKGEKFVHHVIFARANAPEPEGISECDVAFRSSWETLFISGTGVNTLEFPEDAGHVLKKGTQLVAQLHVLNVTDAPVEGSHTIHMRRSAIANPRPVTSAIFGTAAVKLPAQQTSTVVGTCPARGSVKLIAGFPHMHTLGSSLRFEVGPNANELEEVFERDPFDFDNQRIDKLELDIAPGQLTRVTCTFNNTTDQEVGYGESTRNEMCYFVGFAVDTRGGTCIEVLPPNIFGR